MISPDEIAADRAVIDAATGGDWQVLVGASWAGEVVVATSDGHPIAVVSTAPADPGAIADATAIAAARTGWPRALDALEAAQAEIERLRIEVKTKREALDNAHAVHHRTMSDWADDRAAINRVRALCEYVDILDASEYDAGRMAALDAVLAALDGGESEALF